MAYSSGAISLFVSASVLLSLAALFLILRAVAIVISGRSFRWHDFFAYFGYMCTCAYTILMFYATIKGGLGQHVTDLTPTQLTISEKYFWATEFCYAPSTSANRISMLLLFLEIFKTKAFKRWCWVALIGVTLWFVALILLSALSCQPINYQWNKTINGSCVNLYVLEYVSAGVNLLFDLIVTILPIPVIWGLQMPQRKKMTVQAALSLGLVLGGINVGRIVQTGVADQNDFTYAAVDATILVLAELCTGTIVICLPTLGPLVRGRKTKTNAPLERYKMDDAGYYSGSTGYRSSSNRGVWSDRGPGSAVQSEMTQKEQPLESPLSRHGFGDRAFSEADVEQMLDKSKQRDSYYFDKQDKHKSQLDSPVMSSERENSTASKKNPRELV